jgi:ketosteroid isomerase-like protein/quercetin dioxygenase-like cupin family protein
MEESFMPHVSSRHSLAGMSALLAICLALAPSTMKAQTDEQLIRALDSTFNVVYAAHDSVRLGTIYAPNAVGMYPNQPVATGRAAILAGYSQLWGMNAKLSGRPVVITVSKGGDLATVAGRYQMSYTGAQGPVADSGSYFESLQKGPDGKWMIVSEIITSHAPMATTAAATYDTGGDGSMVMSGSTNLKWNDLVIPGFDPGAKVAVLHGDPSSSGDYTVRLQFPDGYRFPVHWHPKAEHLTVVSGQFLLGMGTKVDRTAEKTYVPGDFLYFPAKNTHFGGAKGVTVIQLHGMGPFAVNVGTP